MKIMMKLIDVSLLLVIMTASLCFGAKSDDKPLDLIHADRLLTSGEDINNITNLIGSVHLKHGDTDLRSNRAVWYKKTDIVVFIDSVRLVDSSHTVNCQTLTYYRSSGSASAVGEVVMRDYSEHTLLTATKVDYNKDEDRFIAVGAPVFTLFPDDDTSKTIIAGDSIIYDMSLKTGEAVNDVTITRRNMEAVCDKAEFYDSGENIKLLGKPEVVQNKNQLEGDEIILSTQNRSLVGILVEGNAKAVYRSQPDSSIDQFTETTLEGKQLEAYFINDKLTKAVMRRNAVSHYIPAVSDTIAGGKNTASGDSISLFFSDPGINRVLIIGGARGNYIEEKKQTEGKVVPETTYYKAHEIDYLVDDKMIKLFDMASLNYQTMTLESGQIKYDIGEEILIAVGITEQTDSGEVLVQTPVMMEGKDKLYGQRMVYNIDTRRGKVELGETKFDEGFYYGKELKQVEKDVLFVASGEYTTCDKEIPHFHFYCHKMKMLAKNKVIARPVILFIGPLPVMAIPYYIFPISKGRHSGFTTFQIGNIEGSNRFIRNFGYYWAASDYWDLLTSLDFYENRSVVVNGNVKYALRNVLTGSLKGSFTRNTSWNSSYERNVSVGWGINFAHSQIINETTSLRAGGSFQSHKDYNLDNSYDQEERLRRSVRSNASLNKRWKSESITIAADQTWNLDTDEKTRLLPTISFTRKSLPIFPPSSNKKKTKRILPWDDQLEETILRWYNSFYFRIKSDLKNRHYLSKKSEILDWEKYKTLNSQFSLSSPQKILGILTINPSATIKQTFYKIDKTHAVDSAYVDSVNLSTDDYFRREVWSTSVSAKTDLYGTVYPNIFYVNGLRHVLTPSISYNYAPKTERNKEYYTYTRVGSSSSRKKNMSFSLTQLFQVKLHSGEKEKKLDLLNISSSTNYDFEKEEKKWGMLSNSFRSGALQIVSLSLSTSHSFYDEVTGELHKFDPRLVSLSGSMTFNRKFHLGGEKQSDDEQESQDWDDDIDIPSIDKGSKTSKDTETTLQVSLTHRYTERHSLGKVTSKTRWLGASFDLDLTAGWRIKFECQYDLEEKKTSYPKFELGRNLHCWSGEFIWRPTGPLAGYYVKIFIKQLPDIKIEKSVGGVTGGR